MVPFLSAEQVLAAVSPERAVAAVRDGFVAYARGEWSMPSKVYVPAYPAGDFRAMPALGAGRAIVKWVTSFPGNPERGRAAGLPEHGHRAAGHPLHADDRPHQRRLAAPARPEQPGDQPRLQLEREPVEDDDAAAAHDEALDGDSWKSGHARSTTRTQRRHRWFRS